MMNVGARIFAPFRVIIPRSHPHHNPHSTFYSHSMDSTFQQPDMNEISAGQPHAAMPASGVVTFVFTAIEGAARRWERQPQEMNAALGRYEAIMREAVAAHGGFVFQTISDALCIAFADAGDAMAAAIAAQAVLSAEKWDEALGEIKVEMALHSGEAEQREQGYFAPHTLNRLSRILAAGHGGQILLSAATRQRLGDVLPDGVELRDLGARQLRDVPEVERIYQVVTANLAPHFPPLETLDRRPSNLPAQPNLLIGRTTEVREISALLRQPDVRLVTLSGPGGTGKTRLSLQVANAMLDEFAAGCYFVSLAPISEPERVLDAIAAALNIREAGGKSLLDAVTAALGEQEMLIVLDNFEQVVAAAPLVGQLLAATTRLKLLTTSRETLHLAEEHEYAVQPLRLPDLKQLPDSEALAEYEAVALFLARARAVKFDFQLSAHNAAAVAEICARLDGLPLAIELAAAQSQLLEPQAMLTRLSNRLALLTRGMRNLPPRQQTLRGAIDWSYTLLSEAEQQLFRRLAVFAGGFTSEAVEAICTADFREDNTTRDVSKPAEDASANLKSKIINLKSLDVPHRLTQLVYKSLVRQSISLLSTEGEGQGGGDSLSRSAGDQSASPPPVGEGWGGGQRYTMLETIREYTLDKLTASGELEAIQTAHAAYYLTLAETAEPELRGANQAEWLTRLEQEHDNLRAAIAFSQNHDPANAVRLAGALWRFWEIRGHLSEGRSILAAVLSRGEEADPIYRAKALNGAGNLAFWQGAYAVARQFYEQALQLRREIGDKLGIAASLSNLGNIASEQSDYDAARLYYEESVVLAREMGNDESIATSLYNLGLVAHRQADYDNARILYAESYSIAQKLGDKWNSAGAMILLGLVAVHQGDYQAAQSLYTQSLAIYEQLEYRVGIADALDGLGLVAYSKGDFDTARRLYGEVQMMSRELGYEVREAFSLLLLGAIARRENDYLEAKTLVKNSLALFWKLQDKSGVASALISLGIAVGAESSGIMLERAIHLLSIGMAIGNIINWIPAERIEYERIMQQCRVQLGDASFEQAWHEGAAMSIIAAVKYALELYLINGAGWFATLKSCRCGCRGRVHPALVSILSARTSIIDYLAARYLW